LTERERVRNVRRTLLDESIYPLLPLEVAASLNRLCDAEPGVATPVADVREIFQTAFPEFLV
jgi:hypothetical protein